MKRLKYLLLVLIILFVGCKKNNVELNEFIETARFNGYIIEENKTGYEEYSYIKDIYYAVNRQNAYDIQFLILENDEYAKKFILSNVDEIKENIDSNSYVKSDSLTNYEFYHAENENTYYLIIRSKNNIIYVTAPIDYINEIEEFLSELSIDF